MADYTGTVLRALSLVRSEQLDHGELPAYLWEGPKSVLIVRYPCLSARAHDALGVFDASCSAFEPLAVEALRPSARRQVVRESAEIRRSIRCFLAWLESSRGTWAAYGRGSIAGPDLDTTACSALALADRAKPPAHRISRRLGALLELSYLDAPASPVTLLNSLRYVLRHAGERTPDAAALMDRCGRELGLEDRRYTLPEAKYAALARLTREHPELLPLADLPGLSEVEAASCQSSFPSSLVSSVDSTSIASPSVGSAIETACPGSESTVTASTLTASAAHTTDETPAAEMTLELRPAGATPLQAALRLSEAADRGACRARVQALRDQVLELEARFSGRWPFQALFHPGVGSPALTASFVLSAMARSQEVLTS